MRGTTHNGRTGKDGVYSAKHNDRNFDVDHAPHIDKDRMSDNWYWHYRPEERITFEEAEQRFYEEHFTESLNAKNQRYIEQRHRERVRTMEQYRQSKLSCPEETILQVGRMGDTIAPALLRELCTEQIEWEIRTFPNVKILDVALHVDEQGAPHIHERKVWVAHGQDGLVVGQAKALAEMQIQRPNMNKPQDRYNNAKMTYSAMCREHFLDVCKSKGLDMETEPDKTSRHGLELIEYKAEQEQLKLNSLQAENALLRQDNRVLEQNKEDTFYEHEALLREKTYTLCKTRELKQENAKLEQKYAKLEQEYAKLEQEYDKRIEAIKANLAEYKQAADKYTLDHEAERILEDIGLSDKYSEGMETLTEPYREKHKRLLQDEYER